jgi:hypothetical protein
MISHQIMSGHWIGMENRFRRAIVDRDRLGIGSTRGIEDDAWLQPAQPQARQRWVSQRPITSPNVGLVAAPPPHRSTKLPDQP